MVLLRYTPIKLNFTMYHSASTMTLQFETEKNRKAFIYSASILGALLLIAILVKWPLPKTEPPPIEEFIEVNLGNNMEGFGETQPLIKGEMNSQPTEPEAQPQPQPVKSNDAAAADITNDDEKDEEAAPLTKPVVSARDAPVLDKPITPVKTSKPATVVTPPVEKPRKAVATYQGPGSGNGNGAKEDNGYTGQGNKPGQKGDAGDPKGNPDSYGNTPGGKAGGPRVIGNRKIIKYYSFSGDLDKATIYAIVKVSPSGIGTFAGFGKNSSTRGQAYANAITNYLRNVKFDPSDEESTVTVQFNFSVN